MKTFNRLLITFFAITALFAFGSCEEEHTHEYGSWDTIKMATCTELGERIRSCSCGEKETATLQRTSHTRKYPVQENYTNASCTEGAWYENVVYCADCNAELSRDKFTINDPLPHTPMPSVKEIKKNATCTEDGSYDIVVYCSTCENPISKSSYSISATGHSFGKWTDEIQATCTLGGTEQRTCPCGETEKRQTEAKGHSFDNWTITKNLTCHEDGIKERTCVCGLSETETIKARGHIMSISNCEFCFKSYSTGFEFKLANSNGEYYYILTSIGECDDTDVCIPHSLYNEELNALLPVREIESYAFSQNNQITHLTIPDSIHKIGKNAFRGCTSLKSIKLPFIGETENHIAHFSYIFYSQADSVPESLTQVFVTNCTSIYGYAFAGCSNLTRITLANSVMSIDNSAFYGCSSLTSIEIPYSVISIGDSAFSGCSSLTSVVIPDSVTTISKYAFSDCRSLTSVVIPDSVTTIGYEAFRNCTSLTSVVIPDSVTTIGSSAFSCCDSLTSVVIGNSVTTIGYDAFYYCDSLTSVYITDIAAWCGIEFKGSYSNPLFYAENLYLNGTLVEDLVIPEGVTTIGSSAFYNCSNLTSVVIPDSVTTIGSSAFSGCSSLTSVTIGNGVKTIGDWAFAYCDSLTSVAIGNSVTTISDLAFFSCDSLKYNEYDNAYYLGNENNPYLLLVAARNKNITSVTIHKDTRLIYSNAFYGCSSLTSVVIPDSVTTIGSSAFSGCSSLTSVTIGNNVTSIGSYAFYGCDSLTSVTIPDSVTTIGDHTFAYCMSLVNLNIGKNVSVFGDYAVSVCNSLTNINVSDDNSTYKSIDGNLYSKDEKSLIQYAIGKADTIFYIPSGVKTIKKYAFHNCTNLTNIKIPDSVTTIEEYAFYNCIGLESVTIPYSVTSIGVRPFSNCTTLENIFVDEENSQYCSLDGILYTKKGTTLIQYPAGRKDTSFTIPKTVDFIEYGAFAGSCYLESITIHFIGGSKYHTNEHARYFGYIFATDNVTSPTGGIKHPNSQALPQSLKQVIVKGGAIYDYAFGNCESLTSIILPNTLTYISEGAFYMCSSLTSIEIPKSVTTIGDYAFLFCSSLTSVVISDSVTTIGSFAFSSCSSLTSVTIGNGVKTIDDYAFARCSSLTSVVIPNSVTTIGDYAFSNCTSLVSVLIPNSVTSIGGNAFNNCPDLQFNEYNNEYDNAYYLGNDENPYLTLVKAKTTAIDSVIIHENTKFIQSYAFQYCTTLNSITIPNSVVSIGVGAFKHCSNLTNIIVSNDNPSYKTIDGNLFSKDGKVFIQYAIGKNEICFTIPSGVTAVEDYAFCYCYNIKRITIPESVTYIGNEVFAYCGKLTIITIPNSVTHIGEYAFYRCSNLVNAMIGQDSYTNSSEFAGCDKLVEIYNCSEMPTLTKGILNEYTPKKGESNIRTTSNGFIFYEDNDICYLLGYIGNEKDITLPENYNGKTYEIYKYAFSYCDELRSITIPAGITALGDAAFCYCSGLESINYRGSEIEWDALPKESSWDYATGTYTITYNYAD